MQLGVGRGAASPATPFRSGWRAAGRWVARGAGRLPSRTDAVRARMFHAGHSVCLPILCRSTHNKLDLDPFPQSTNSKHAERLRPRPMPCAPPPPPPPPSLPLHHTISLVERPRPLVKLYAGLEAGIGLFALLFPLLLAAATPPRSRWCSTRRRPPRPRRSRRGWRVPGRR